MKIWHAPDPGRLALHQLEPLTALFDTASGQTHIIAEPLPQILDALADGPCDSAGVAVRLAARFGTGTDAASVDRIGECLVELAAMGLVQAQDGIE